MDKAGRLYQVRDGQETVTYAYYANGSTQRVGYSSGATEEYTYYDNDKLRTLTNRDGNNAIIDAYNYGYDGNSNIVTILDGKGTTTYAYDALNRLVAVAEPGGKETAYAYDGAGNRLTETVATDGDTAVTSYTYDGSNRLLSTRQVLGPGAENITEYYYDPNGNLPGRLLSALADGEAGSGGAALALIGQAEGLAATGAINVPTLVMSGVMDLSTPLIAKTMYDAIPGAKWELFEFSRHMIFVDENAKYSALLSGWLSQHD